MTAVLAPGVAVTIVAGRHCGDVGRITRTDDMTGFFFVVLRSRYHVQGHRNLEFGPFSARELSARTAPDQEPLEENADD